MVPFFEMRGIFGLHFITNPNDLVPQKIVLFFRLINQATQQDNPFEWLADMMIKHEILWVYLSKTPLSRLDDELTSDTLSLKKKMVRKSYANALDSIKETARKLSSNKEVGARNSVRMVQKMVDLIMEDDVLFMGASTIRVFDDYTYAHSLNVAILAMCLGKRIGLSHILLERLGLCGLYHDLGKVEIPKEVLNKKGALSEAERALLNTHSMHSARLILRLKAENTRKNKILVPPFEHHMGYDNSGYPQTATGPKISLFGRILTIVDVYDAITSARTYRQNVLSPDRALKKMLAQSGTQFDPILLKIFINMLGKYPIGTLLKLDNGEIGLVKKPSNEMLTRPIVQLLVSEADQKYRKGAVLDLAERNEETGQYSCNILETIHPEAIGIQPAEFFL
jgi:HD-GYP domain-containing protein (c-di-GMP phosphodiesterase class II)